MDLLVSNDQYERPLELKANFVLIAQVRLLCQNAEGFLALLGSQGKRTAQKARLSMSGSSYAEAL